MEREQKHQEEKKSNPWALKRRASFNIWGCCITCMGNKTWNSNSDGHIQITIYDGQPTDKWLQPTLAFVFQRLRGHDIVA